MLIILYRYYWKNSVILLRSGYHFLIIVQKTGNAKRHIVQAIGAAITEWSQRPNPVNEITKVRTHGRLFRAWKVISKVYTNNRKRTSARMSFLFWRPARIWKISCSVNERCWRRLDGVAPCFLFHAMIGHFWTGKQLRICEFAVTLY